MSSGRQIIELAEVNDFSRQSPRQNYVKLLDRGLVEISMKSGFARNSFFRLYIVGHYTLGVELRQSVCSNRFSANFTGIISPSRIHLVTSSFHIA